MNVGEAVLDPTAHYTARQMEILDAAISVFSHHGYRGGTIALIAGAAGLSQPGLIHHFPNKDAILMAVVELREREDFSTFDAVFADGGNVFDAMETVLRKNAQRPELVRLFAVLSTEALNPEHPAHAFFAERYARLLTMLAEQAAIEQAGGLIRADIGAGDIAKLLAGAADGLRYQTLLAGNDIDHWRQIAALRRAFVTS